MDDIRLAPFTSLKTDERGRMLEMRWSVGVFKGDDMGGTVWESDWFDISEFQQNGEHYKTAYNRCCEIVQAGHA